MAIGQIWPLPLAEREYLYIDGGCVRASVRKISKDLFGDANAYQAYIPAIVDGGYSKIFYYDAVPGKNHGESQAAYEARVQPDHDRFAAIQALDRVHVALGQIVGADKRQKGVDVRLAVDMMTHAFRGKVSKVTLLAGDADFVPLIRSLVSEGLHVNLWHPPQASSELKGAADSTRLFNIAGNFNMLTHDGTQPAFRVTQSNNGGIGPVGEEFKAFKDIAGEKFAGRWKDNTLNVWRRSQNGNWFFIHLQAPSADLARALVAFDAMHAWGIAATGADWIET